MTAILNGVEITKQGRMVEATVEGVKYMIPEAWLMGACRSMRFNEALYHWHHQELLATDLHPTSLLSD